jgi:uracil phosphoribosyltransferase
LSDKTHVRLRLIDLQEDPVTNFPNLSVAEHPLVQHKVSLLRNKGTGIKLFTELVEEIATLLACEATRDLPLEEVDVETPLEVMKGRQIQGKKLVIVPILRAGLGMVEGVRRVIPGARVGHIGLYRNEETLEPVEYYFKAPDPEGRSFFLVDPMLATGGSATAAVHFLKGRGATRITMLSIVSAPEGVRRMLEDHPDVFIFTTALDRGLNELGYIVPGLGDAGDRLYGTRART